MSFLIDPRGQITLAHLLHMSSGLESDGAKTLEAYWGGIDTGAAVTPNAWQHVATTLVGNNVKFYLNGE